MELQPKILKQDLVLFIVPPRNWAARKPGYQARLNELIISSPIEQNLFGKGGIYECLHIPKKSITYQEYKARAKELDHITDRLSPQEVERMFWKNAAFSPPLYGADLSNSLMDEHSGTWNLNNLDSLLKNAVGHQIKGINTSYCYVGSWKALFCWHTEDLDLSAINFLHEGKSKFWYAIQANDRKFLEKQAAKLFPEHYSSCNEFLRHKMTLINPYYIKKKYPDIKIVKAQQKENSFIIAFGGCYHSGFNFGFNIAQAVNFGTINWLKLLPKVNYCKCTKSSVKVSVYQVYNNLLKDEIINKTEQFLEFQDYIYQKAKEEQSEQDREQTKKGLKTQFSRKIKKTKKIPKKIQFNNEDYEVENWAQCDHCGLWRVVSGPLNNKQPFSCDQIKKKCYRKEKISRKLFLLNQ